MQHNGERDASTFKGCVVTLLRVGDAAAHLDELNVMD